MAVEPLLWDAILATVYAHPNAPEAIRYWRVDLVAWAPPTLHWRDDAPPESPVQHPPVTREHVTEQTVEMAEGEALGVPFGFAWSADARRVVVGLSEAHGGPSSTVLYTKELQTRGKSKGGRKPG